MTLYVKKDRIVDICRYLHDEPSMAFQYIRDITAVDWMEKKDARFEVVYHLYAIKFKEMIRIKAAVEEREKGDHESDRFSGWSFCSSSARRRAERPWIS